MKEKVFFLNELLVIEFKDVEKFEEVVKIEVVV